MMKCLLVLSVLLCVSLSVRGAAVVPVETAAEEHEETAGVPVPEAEAESTAVALPQARLSFCLDGWHSYRGNCYLLVNTYYTWANAESYCASYEGSLVSAHSVWEYRFLQRLAQTGGHSFAWMGGYYFQGDWRWEDGTLFDYNNWYSVSSTNYYQCLQLNSQNSKGWSNHGCNMLFPFICELRSNC